MITLINVDSQISQVTAKLNKLKEQRKLLNRCQRSINTLYNQLLQVAELDPSLTIDKLLDNAIASLKKVETSHAVEEVHDEISSTESTITHDVDRKLGQNDDVDVDNSLLTSHDDEINTTESTITHDVDLKLGQNDDVDVDNSLLTSHNDEINTTESTITHDVNRKLVKNDADVDNSNLKENFQKWKTAPAKEKNLTRPQANDWQTLGKNLVYSLQLQTIEISTPIEDLARKWQEYLLSKGLVSLKNSALYHQQNGWAFTCGGTRANAQKLVELFDFQNNPPTYYYYSQKNRQLYLGCRDRITAEVAIAKIREQSWCVSKLTIRTAKVINDCPYEIQGTLDNDYELEYLLKFNFDRPISHKSNQKVLQELEREWQDAKVIDFQTIKSETDCYIKQLGWKIDKCRDFLLEHYNKRSRLHLTDEELWDFLDKLKASISKKKYELNRIAS